MHRNLATFIQPWFCRGVLGLEGGEGVLEKFYQSTVESGAEERGAALDSSSGIGGVHNSLVAEGQSRQVITGLVDRYM